MIETGGSPTIGCVTGSALRPKATCVRIILKMAGCTICWCFLEDAILMTACAGDGCVFSIQLEGELGMIHICGLPSIWSVTTCAGCSELSFVEIIFLMAGVAILRGGFEIV